MLILLTNYICKKIIALHINPFLFALMLKSGLSATLPVLQSLLISLPTVLQPINQRDIRFSPTQ